MEELGAARLLDWQRTMDRRKRDIFSYRIFSYFEGEKEKHVSGYLRKYLNNDQKTYWNYYFRPNLALIQQIDEKDLSSLARELQVEKSKLQTLNSFVRRLSQQNLRWIMAVSALAGTGFAILAIWWPGFAIAMLAAWGLAVWLWKVLPRIETQGRVDELESRIAAILKYRKEIADLEPEDVPSEEEMELRLEAAINHLVEDEKRKLKIRVPQPGKFKGPEPDHFRLVQRWALETDRTKWLEDALKVTPSKKKGQKPRIEKYKPPLYWVARRGPHYIRYDIQIIFVHQGHVTLYQGFYDLIQGEWLGVARKHIVLANLLRIDDEVTEDFDFVQRRIMQASEAGEVDTTGDGYAEEGASSPNAESVRPDAGHPPAPKEDDLDFITVTQARTIRFVGNAGESVEIKFATSGQRESMISKLRGRREALEVEMTREAVVRADDIRAGANEDRAVDAASIAGQQSAIIARFDEELQRLQRSKTIDNVDRLIDLILAHTRWTTSQPHLDRRNDTSSA